MKKFLLVIMALTMMGGSLPLAAASANFQANCSFPGLNCVLDANRTPSFGTPTSCSPSTPSSYFWDFNTSTSSDDLFTSSSFVSHTYTSGYCDVINMAVFCNNGASATKTHCICTFLGVNGCVRPGAGWTP